jgi:hypothetical protein
MRHRARKIVFLVCLTVLSIAAATIASADKVPKCSKRLCQDVGCAADFYCASGATVKSCAEICGH